MLFLLYYFFSVSNDTRDGTKTHTYTHVIIYILYEVVGVHSAVVTQDKYILTDGILFGVFFCFV
jgi:hypothetical protein